MMSVKYFYLGAIVCSVASFFSVQAEAKECGKNQYAVRAHFRRAYVKANGTVVKATNVKASCKDKSLASIFLEGKVKDGLPSDWPHKSEKGKAWTEEEKNLLIEALESAPVEMIPKNLLGFYRADKSREFPNPATHGQIVGSEEGFIVIYDNAFSHKASLARILVHEIGHQIYVELNMQDKGAYHTVMNWFVEEDAQSKRVKVLGSRLGDFVRDDSRERPEEDFANNLEFFLFEPQKLKKVAPHAHRWILQHFGDKFKLGGSK